MSSLVVFAGNPAQPDSATPLGRVLLQSLEEGGFSGPVTRLDIEGEITAKLSELAQTLTDKHRVEVRPFAGDLGVSAEQTALVDMAGDIDILVNNAGGIPSGGITKIDEATWRKGWDLKVFGYINITRAVYPKMVARGKGVIVNVIGEAGESPFADYIAGCSGNAALIAMNKALGLASFKRGVRVVAVNPGPTNSERHQAHVKIRAERELGDPARWAELHARFPAGRAADVIEVARAVAFLASDAASYISGASIRVDGGISMSRPV